MSAEGFAREFGLSTNGSGTFPAPHANPFVVQAMNQVGIDVSQSRPKELDEKLIEEAGVIVPTHASLAKAVPRIEALVRGPSTRSPG